MTDPTAPATDARDRPRWWEEHPLLALSAAAFAALLLTFLWGLVIVVYGTGDRSYALGTFGDAFGPVTSILNAIALGAAVLAVVLQRRELAMQRDEMRAQRDEMRAQRIAAEAQLEVQRAHVAAIQTQTDVLRAQAMLATIQVRAQMTQAEYARDASDPWAGAMGSPYTSMWDSVHTIVDMLLANAPGAAPPDQSADK